MNLSQYAADLRNVCFLIEERPALANATWFLGANEIHPRLYTFVYEVEKAKALIAGTGKWDKQSTDTNIMFVQRIALNSVWEIQVIMSHEVANCRKVLTGNKVTRKVPTGYTEIEEDEYVWECPDSILSTTKPA